MHNAEIKLDLSNHISQIAIGGWFFSAVSHRFNLKCVGFQETVVVVERRKY